MDLMDIYKLFHPAAAQYTFFSAAQRIFSKTDIVVHKESLSKYKKSEIIPCIILDHNGI
jgi:hypothetical protein